MSDAGKAAGPILALDCGSTLTRAILIDWVDDEYRLLGQGRVLSRERASRIDLTGSVRQALGRLSDVTCR